MLFLDRSEPFAGVSFGSATPLSAETAAQSYDCLYMACTTVVGDTIDALELGNAQTLKNLTVFPIKRDRAQPASNYLLLDEAMERKALRIEEISQGGSVPELKVVNSADLPVMILDGEELLGAKQNRVLNLTVLVPAHSTLKVPVSCVERGRWHYNSQFFSSSKQTQYAKGRASRAAQVSHSYIATGERTSDQGQIWADIAEKLKRLGAHSASSSMADIYAAHDNQVDEYVKAFSAVEGQTGALFAINGRVHGLDMFDSSRTLRTVLPKLVRAYALDAIDSPAGEPNATSADDGPKSFLNVLRAAEIVEMPAVGTGSDLRFKSGEIAGGALIADGSLLHLFAFREDKTGENAGSADSSPVSRLFRRSRQPQQPA
jgi:hypothetical protein